MAQMCVSVGLHNTIAVRHAVMQSRFIPYAVSFGIYVLCILSARLQASPYLHPPNLTTNAIADIAHKIQATKFM